MKKTILAILFAAAALPAVLAQGGVWYASPGGSGDGSSEGSPTSFDVALTQATSGDQIILAAGQYPLSQTVDISTGITITGAGAGKTFFLPVKGEQIRLFRLNHSGAVLEKVTVKGGIIKASSGQKQGSGVLIDEQGGTLRDCRVTECQGLDWGDSGGAVAMKSANALVARCTIDHNEHTSNGQGGGVYMKAGRLENCLIYKNKSLWVGGGVYYAGGTIRNCTIVGNESVKQQGGGIYWQGTTSEGVCLSNLIVTGNKAPADTSEGAPDWSAGNDFNAFNTKTSNCYFESKPAGVAPVVGEVEFANPAEDDYTLLASSGLIDQGTAYVGAADETDLAGKPRQSGAALDLGCYEYDQSVASCGFLADSTTLFEGAQAVFSPVVYGAPEGAELTYSWKLQNLITEQETTLEGANPSVTFDAAGRYDVTLNVTDGVGFSVTGTRAAYILVVGEKMYVAPADAVGVTPAFPWATPQTASKDLSETIATAIDGSVIEVLPGTHYVSGQIYLDRAVKIIGSEMDQTILTRDPQAPDSDPKVRLFYLDHSDAVVEGLTIQGVESENADGFGYAVLIAGRGGTLRNCRVTGCQAMGTVERGAVAIMSTAGLVDRCVIDKNHTLHYNGPAGGAYISAGCIENSLIKENVASWAGGGLYYAGGLVRNCTITENSSDKQGGGIYWEGWCSAQFGLQNLIVAGNRAPNDSNPGAPEWACKDGTDGNFKEKTTHCLFGNSEPVGQSPVTGDPCFADPENGDYSIVFGSAAVDKGLAYEGIETAVDLAGAARSSGPAVDLGCYEYDQSQPACGFSVSPSSVLQGGTVTLTGYVIGTTATNTLVYDWTLTDRNNHSTQLGAPAGVNTVEAVLDTPGWYAVTLTVKGDNDQFNVTSTRDKVINVAARDSYLADPEDTLVTPTYPWDTPETASTNLQELLDAAIDGTTIHLPAAVFAFSKPIAVEKGVVLSGAGVDRTIFKQADEMDFRLLTLNHSGAVVEKLTVKGVKNNEVDCKGIGVLLGASGGTLRHCRVTECVGNGPFQHAAVCLLGEKGRVSHCIIDHNQVLVQGLGGGVNMAAGRLENSLVYGNYAQYKGAGVYFKGGHICNCTFTTNTVGTESNSHGGGLYCEDETARKGSITNCIFAGNFAPNDVAGGTQEWYAGFHTQSQTDLNVVLNEISSNCLFGDSKTFGQNALTGDPMFLDPGKNDYRISRNSPAHDAGAYAPWMDEATDLAGNPRVDHKQLVDIGCYESVYVRSATVLLLR